MSSGFDEVTPTEGEQRAEPDARARRRWPTIAGGAVAFAALVALYVHSVRAPSTIAGLRVAGQPMGGVPFAELDARVGAAIDQFLDGRVVLAFGRDSLKATRRDAGFIVDRAEAVRAAREAGKRGNPLSDLAARSRARRGKLDLDLPLDLDRPKALEFLTEIKDDVDRAPVDARLDLERHTIAPESPGYLLRVYDSMVALEYAARSGQPRIELPVAATPPRVTAADLKDVDISTVLGNWETHYSSVGMDSDRTYNLKVGADHLNGHILKPHEIFSFNEVVGDRTEKEGYRVAPVIQGGELIDGLAGGMCQIASTLHAASFFAGLEIVSSTPHSRPSAYIPMGLDSTVVYPTTDLKLRNPYDFPVVMHYQVNQGVVKVELLGKERPDRVLFEREIKTETPFPTETRTDPEAPSGQRITLQEGYPGYTLIRRRYVFEKDATPRWSGPEPVADLLAKQHKKPLAKQQWALHYPATAHIVAIGTGPSKLKPKPQPPAHHIPPVGAKDKPIYKMLR
ncbi:MAG TPA: VanW family protein [Polyangia bacterium]|nr:VanW family protein [Polyangia bacterium]